MQLTMTPLSKKKLLHSADTPHSPPRREAKKKLLHSADTPHSPPHHSQYYSHLHSEALLGEMQ